MKRLKWNDFLIPFSSLYCIPSVHTAEWGDRICHRSESGLHLFHRSSSTVGKVTNMWKRALVPNNRIHAITGLQATHLIVPKKRLWKSPLTPEHIASFSATVKALLLLEVEFIWQILERERERENEADWESFRVADQEQKSSTADVQIFTWTWTTFKNNEKKLMIPENTKKKKRIYLDIKIIEVSATLCFSNRYKVVHDSPTSHPIRRPATTKLSTQ